MKKNLLLMVVFSGILSMTNAQISFTSANAPKAGTSVKVQGLENDSLYQFNAGLAGANRVWNFANFKFDATLGINQTNYVSRAKTIYANDPRISGATYGSFDIDTPEDITFDSISTTTWWTIATADSAGLERVDPIERQMTFPWTYNSSFKDSLSGIEIDPMTGDTARFLSLNTAKCDAYGSITTSIGTFNCLRTIRTIKQDVEFFPGFGLSVSAISTEWWATQHPQPVFSVTRLKIDFLGVEDSLVIATGLVQTRVANEEIAKIDLNTYPNPAQNTINIDFDNVESQKIALSVFSLSGQMMRLDRFDAPQGKQQRTLDVTNFPNGIYMVHLASEKGKNLGMRKIVVQH